MILHRDVTHRAPHVTKGRTVTHVTERSSAGSTGAEVRPPAVDGRRRAVASRKRTVTYADAGVSIHAGEQAVELLKSKVQQARTRPEVMGDLGGFAGLFRLDTQKYKNPILASSTDGVGTKLVIAQQLDIHDTVGIDLVAMVVDDLVACGAEPLFLLDYIACGEVVPDKVAEIGAGIADGCRYAGCALLGGETAEHPGVLRPRRVRRVGHRRRRGRGERDPRPRPGRGRRRRSSRCARPACTPTATRWSGTCCSAPAGCGSTRWSTTSARSAPSARSCSRRPRSTRRTAWT